MVVPFPKAPEHNRKSISVAMLLPPLIYPPFPCMLTMLLSVTLLLSVVPSSTTAFVVATSAPWKLPRASSSRGWTTRGGSQMNDISTIGMLATTTDETFSSSVTISPANLELLSERGRKAIENLLHHDTDRLAQTHVYGNWPEAGTNDTDKQRLAEQLADLDESYPGGGLSAYLTKAVRLLEESATGSNPFENYQAFVPHGEVLEFDTEALHRAEAMGYDACGGVVFCLVAGGLGERLGYSGIKLSLATNLCTEECYLEYYIKYILALQHKVNSRNNGENEEGKVCIPLVIMTSGDTDAPTRQLLADNKNFGMDDDQIIIVTQEKVAALKDGNAGLALEDNDRWTVQTKPHGHGDVHQLLRHLVDGWIAQGKTHVIFLQDTNALVTNSVLPTLGVSIAQQFVMNSICIPRLAGEAAGAIARLEHKTDPNKSLVINVEYNQLDPLLKTQGDCLGDVPDPTTGYSPFPGNANNLVIELQAYAKTLKGEDKGVVLEFVNPKYKDNTRTDFSKPTRLECMMQDIPKLFQKELGQPKIGFTMFDRWFTFSPAKNSLEAGQKAVKGGSAAPGTLSSAESDFYVQNVRKMECVGNFKVLNDDNEDAPLVLLAGIPVTAGPRVVLAPSIGATLQGLKDHIQGPITMTKRSILVIEGHDVIVKKLHLDGALVIKAEPDSHITVDGLQVDNLGWSLEELDAERDYPEAVRIRGYTIDMKETREYIVSEPGDYVIDSSGEITKLA